MSNSDFDENDLDELIVLYALGEMDPDIASDFETELQKRPELQARVDGLRFINGSLLENYISAGDFLEKTRDEENTDVEVEPFVAQKEPDSQTGPEPNPQPQPYPQPTCNVPENNPKSLFLRTFGYVAVLAMFTVVGFLLFSSMFNKPGSTVQVAQNNANDGGQTQSSSNPDNGDGAGGGSNSPTHIDGDEMISNKILEDNIDTNKLASKGVSDIKDEIPKSGRQTAAGTPRAGVSVNDEIPKSAEALLATFTKESQDKPEVQSAVSQFYKLINDLDNATLEDFDKISDLLTPEIVGNDENLKSFKERIEKMARVTGF